MNRSASAMLAVLTFGCLCSHVSYSQDIFFESKYLSQSVAGFHGYSIKGELNGAAKLTLDPNVCTLNLFGDRALCTLIALTVEDVTLSELKIHDPAGRRAFAVSSHGLQGDLKLITTKASTDAWFVLTERNGARTVVDLDPASPTESSLAPRIADSCISLPQTVDGTKAQHKVVAGFVNGTWFLILEGKKLNLGSRIEFRPVHYVQRPEYWQIQVLECSDGIVLPTIAPYESVFEITPFLGTKGIELVFADGNVRINVPPTAKK